MHVFAAAVACGLCSPVLAISGLVELTHDDSRNWVGIGNNWRETIVLLSASLVTGSIAMVLGRGGFDLGTLRRVKALTSAVGAFVTLCVVAWIVYLAAGTFARPDDALYEAVTGVSTSSLTVLAQPEQMPLGMLVWRSGTQWLGGLMALMFAIGLLPFLGGSRELADPNDQRRTTNAIASRPLPALRRVGSIYCLISAVVWIAFLLAGLSAPDSLAHTMSTVSTGGFSTGAGSVGRLDSVLVEVLTIIVMGGAGSSVAFVWLVWRRQFSDARRSFELRIYLLAIGGATAWIAIATNGDGRSAGRAILDSLFTVTSLTSTTGHHVADWAVWQPSAVFLLLMLMAIGGMAGSVAGGLRWLRVIGLVQYIWRELERQLHPRSIASVKVGKSSISEASVDRMHAQLVHVMLVGTGGAIVLGLLGSEFTSAISLAISAISTTGPGVASDGTIVHAGELSRWSRAALMPLMLSGRMFLYPVLVTIGATFFAVNRKLGAGR